MLAAFITTILYSCSAICGRRVAHYVDGTEANLVRLLYVSILLGVGSWLCRSFFSAAAFPWLFASGCVGFGMGDLAMFHAYPRLGTRRTMLMTQCLAAPFGALIEFFWLHHAPTAAQAGSGTLILFGVSLALVPAKGEGQPIHGLFAGACFGTLAALGQGGGAVMSRKAYEIARAAGQEFHGVRDGLGIALQRVLGGITVSALFFLYLKLAHKPFATRKADWRSAWPWLLVTGLCGPALGVTCFQWALMTEKTSIVLPIVATTPLAVMPLAHYLEGDRITWRTTAGGVIAVAGVVRLMLAK